MPAKTMRLAAGALLLLAAAPAAAAPAPPATASAWTTPTPMTANGSFVMRDGEAIYRYVCAACHMQDAKGAQGAGIYPALAGNPKLNSSAYIVTVVTHGLRGMPEFGAMLDDEQIAAVAGYIRTHFGNSFAQPVTAAEVRARR
jgi:mono/diheme cytochrome c family protein